MIAVLSSALTCWHGRRIARIKKSDDSDSYSPTHLRYDRVLSLRSGEEAICRSAGSALLIASRTARTNSSRDANCFGSMGAWNTSVAVPPLIKDVPLGIISYVPRIV